MAADEDNAMVPRVADPGWVGRCRRCGYVLVLQEAATDEAGTLIDWPCYVMVGRNRQCLGTFGTLPDQQALLAAYLLGGHFALLRMLP